MKIKLTVDRSVKLNITEPKVYAVRDYVMSVKQVDSKQSFNQNNIKIVNYT